MRLKLSSSILFLIVASFGLAAQGTFRVDGPAARIVCSGSPSVVLFNMNFQNNASSTMLTAGNSEFRFTGNATTNITSSGPFNTTFYNFEINYTAGEIDVLTNNMTITNSNILEMVQGNVDMNTLLGSTWELGTSVANLGTLNRTSGHFYNGYFRRWYPAGPGTDTAPWDIPVGMNAASYNYARVYYVNATSGGSLRTRFVPGPTFYTGLPLVDATDLVSCPGPVDINNYANEGYWDIIAGGGLDVTSNYTIKLHYNNFGTATAEQCIRIIKSENLSSWMQEGVHGTFNGALDWVTRDLQTGFPSAFNSSFFTVAGDYLVNPLPVEMIAFGANCGTGNILINWSTASENGNDYFILERTKNMIDWEWVANVPSQNSYSNSLLNYSFEDNIAVGTYYYRITQVDFNGEQNSFPPVVITCGASETEAQLVNSYQNDQGGITVVVYSPGDMDYVVSLFDLHGRKVSASVGQASAGNNTILLNTQSLRDAYYLVSVQIGDKNLSRKIFVK